MDWLTFISKLADAFAWPLAVIAALVLFRAPIIALFPGLRRLRYKDFEVEFDKEIEALKAAAGPDLNAGIAETDAYRDVRSRLTTLADIAPNAAVLEAWTQVQGAAKALIERRGHKMDYDVAEPYRLIQQIMERSGILERRKIKIFQDLRRLRNKAAHADDFDVSPAQAKEYVGLAMSLAGYLDKLANGAAA